MFTSAASFASECLRDSSASYPHFASRRGLGFHGSHAASHRKLESLRAAESVELHRILFGTATARH